MEGRLTCREHQQIFNTFEYILTRNYLTHLNKDLGKNCLEQYTFKIIAIKRHVINKENLDMSIRLVIFSPTGFIILNFLFFFSSYIDQTCNNNTELSSDSILNVSPLRMMFYRLVVLPSIKLMKLSSKSHQN